ncbi:MULTISPECIES: ABC transporter ATP-binding protein [unclassified Pseudomonas]|uniref:ABC transporter ATP-binding protein n=1 Tax=unclassified Pseudomonas TaxID=196821 RepID=UPI0025ED58B2|nr:MULTISPECIES: ABC transporter ATP-binding protein [unclassified Pseudomonas]
MAVLSCTHVQKQYMSRVGIPMTAVKDFNLTLQHQEFFCLLGPSGCGKSTVLTMLAGFELPSRGDITLDGQNITGPSRDRGMVFQGDDSLYPWLTALENIAFGLKLAGASPMAIREEAMGYLEMVGLSGQQNKYPAELSGGMKQRIQIARALAAKPKMLLMDEPFGALDAQTRGVMQHQLRDIWHKTGSTVVFITHDIDEAIVLGSRVGIMTAGPGGTLKTTIDIDLGEQRSRSDPGYNAYYGRIESTIREEVDKTYSIVRSSVA